MNEEYINNLEEGKELDELVAIEFMGWHKGITEFGSNAWLDKDNRFQCGFSPYYGDNNYYYEDDEDFHLLHWHPSASYLWAEKVIDRAIELGYEPIVYMSKDQYVCRMKVTGQGTTLPEAVCKAALLSVL